MKRTIALLISAILFASVVVLRVVPDTQAEEGCTLASLKGPYGFIVAGFFQGTPPGPVATVATFPFTRVGLRTFDGAGNFVEVSTRSNNGRIASRTGTGIYTVNPDCTGTMMVTSTIPPGGGGPPPSNIVIVAEGSEVLIISQDPGDVISGVAKRAQEECTLASLTGPYGARVTGFGQGTGPGAFTIASNPSTSVGIVTFDGAGSVTAGPFTSSFNGTITLQTATGTYTVNSDCTGSFAFTPPGGGTANFVILAKGSELLAISTNPGGVESAVARKL